MTALAYALKLLSRQDYTEKKLTESLQKKQFDSCEIEKALEVLISEGLVDDFGYAERYVESKKCKYGRKRLAFFLKQKGVAEEVIERALESVDEEEELDGALKTARAKYQLLFKKYSDGCSKSDFDVDAEANVCTKFDRFRIRSKLFDALIRSGFSYEISNRAVEELLNGNR